MEGRAGEGGRERERERKRWGERMVHLPLSLCRLALETDLKIEREWRGTLQRNLEQEKAKLTRLQTEVQHLSDVKKVINPIIVTALSPFTFIHHHYVMSFAILDALDLSQSSVTMLGYRSVIMLQNCNSVTGM